LAGLASCQERRDDEVAAIVAIYGEDVSCSTDPATTGSDAVVVVQFRVEAGSPLVCNLEVFLDSRYPISPPTKVRVSQLKGVLVDVETMHLCLLRTSEDLRGEESLQQLYESAKEFLEHSSSQLHSPDTAAVATQVAKLAVPECGGCHFLTADARAANKACATEPPRQTLSTHAGSTPNGRRVEDDVGLRAVSLQFLIDFAWEHDVWGTPTNEVVRDVIIPATVSKAVPFTSLLDPCEVGGATVFVSHAWSNPFGLVVAAVRKFASEASVSAPPAALSSSASSVSSSPSPPPPPPTKVFVWLDMFAITQHPGPVQAHDLGQLEPTIARAACTTLVVLDEASALPLKRCWCIFEIYATLLHSQGRFGKLQVRAGRADPQNGDFFPCLNREALAELAQNVDAATAGASVAADKAMILSRLTSLARSFSSKASSKSPSLSSEHHPSTNYERNGAGGIVELNRKLQRAVRHGW